MIPRNAVGEIIPVLLATRIAVPDSENNKYFILKNKDKTSLLKIPLISKYKNACIFVLKSRVNFALCRQSYF